ncbi:MAG: hypothetical protein PHF63_00990 [Herbinix sp.]|nr:hypothetical protein [Herbinix sp.]
MDKYTNFVIGYEDNGKVTRLCDSNYESVTFKNEEELIKFLQAYQIAVDVFLKAFDIIGTFIIKSKPIIEMIKESGVPEINFNIKQ